jgi:hypothetical protein
MTILNFGTSTNGGSFELTALRTGSALHAHGKNAPQHKRCACASLVFARIFFGGAVTQGNTLRSFTDPNGCSFSCDQFANVASFLPRSNTSHPAGIVNSQSSRIVDTGG